MMKRLMTVVLLAIALTGVATAQTIKMTGTLQGDVPADLKLYVMPVDGTQSRPDSITVEDGLFKAVTRRSPYNIYKVVGVANRRQVIVPFHAAATDGETTLSLSVSNGGDICFGKADADTKALEAFTDITVERGKAIWMQGKDMDAERLKALVLGYGAVADSLIGVYRPSDTTAQFLRLWASISTYDNMESLRFATGHTPSSVGIDQKAEIKRMAPSMDCGMALAFDSSVRMLLASIPEGTLAERMGAVESTVKNADLRQRIEDSMIGHYISTFHYAANYDAGLKELTDLTARYNLDQKYLREFKMRKASIAGTPFPENVILTDIKGNKVDFSKYRGKYVFIDMWASWCVPCIKEIPHLKALEKDLQNKNVVFVSLSIDTNEAAWKKKVAALGLEGELLINKDNSLAKALNVSGIPFFLIYDKEGRLYKYSAPRPSDTRLKPLLEGLK